MDDAAPGPRLATAPAGTTTHLIHPAALEPGARHAYDGTFRSRPPGETLDRVMPLLPRYGITRVANITGLDRIGLPVVNVVRPLSRSVSVSTGKGVSLEAAKVSGIMESIEAHHAENLRLPVHRTTVATVARLGRPVDLTRLPMRDDAPPLDEAPLAWVEGFDILGQTPRLLPLETVTNDFTIGVDRGPEGIFFKGSNGLASGNNVLEAITHALYEIIERDAITLFHYHFGRVRAFPRLDLDHPCLDGPRALIERIHSLGMEVHLWDITSDVGVPCAYCMIWEGLAASRSKARATIGSGCHASPSIAMSRAITEAAQDRLTLIAGARDDLLARNYVIDGDFADRIRESLEIDTRPPVAPSWPADPCTPTYDAELRRVCANLAAVGIEEAVAVDLGWPEHPDISVAKVVVPGLEPPHDDVGYQPGPRVLAPLGIG